MSAPSWRRTLEAVAALHDRPGVPPFLVGLFRRLADLEWAGRVDERRVDPHMRPLICSFTTHKAALAAGCVRGAAELPQLQDRRSQRVLERLVDLLEEQAEAAASELTAEEREVESAYMEAEAERLDQLADRLVASYGG